MNDRFRFRVWDKSFCRMIYNIFFFWKENAITVYELHKDASKSYLPNSHIILEQCTGLKDKNGKLIYEGDIVVLDDTDSFENPIKTVVRWAEENASFGLFCSHNLYYGFSSYESENFEVIGNIHENPELLDGKNEK